MAGTTAWCTPEWCDRPAQRLSVMPPALRVYCVPHAIGSASLYGEWSDRLPSWVRVVPLEYPGHGRRFGQPPLTAIGEIACVFARELAADLDGPYALFGHSMGALVTFELARELRQQRAPLPVKLYAAASRPPVVFWPPNRGQYLSALSDSALLSRLNSFGGTPSELLHNAELMDLMLPIARADLTACEEYLYRPAPPLSCPITALGGVGDVTFDQSELTRWDEMTSATFEVVAMPGGHFFVRTAAALLSWLAEDFRRVLGFSR